MPRTGDGRLASPSDNGSKQEEPPTSLPSDRIPPRSAILIPRKAASPEAAFHHAGGNRRFPPAERSDLHHSAHVGHAGAGACPFLLGRLGDDRLGREDVL